MITMDADCPDSGAGPQFSANVNPLPKTKPQRRQLIGKLHNKVAIVTGADNPIGRAVSLAFAREGADIFLIYQKNYQEVEHLVLSIENEGRKCVSLGGDVGSADFCMDAIASAIRSFSRIDILVNATEQMHMQECIENLSPEQVEQTFRTNVFSIFNMTRAALRYLKRGSCIINATSEAAYHGEPNLLDYSASMAAVVALTRSLAVSLIDRNIRVNAVASGPPWLSMVPAGMDDEEEASSENNVPHRRTGQPEDIAPTYVFLASADAAYMTGEILHPNSGDYSTP